jgi:archaemetzincin
MPAVLRRLPLIVALAAMAFLEISVQSAVSGKQVLLIQPLGAELPNEDMALVQQALVGFYNVQIRMLPRVDLPEQAYYEPRRRYRAEKILPFLLDKLPSDGDRILGLTGADISTDKGSIKDWGILGLAALGGKECVISAFRCYRRSREGAYARIVLAKVAVHEVGHTLGLDHCTTEGCLMADAGGLVLTCDREFDICLHCRSRLKAKGYELPDPAHIPWPRP